MRTMTIIIISPLISLITGIGSGGELPRKKN